MWQATKSDPLFLLEFPIGKSQARADPFHDQNILTIPTRCVPEMGADRYCPFDARLCCSRPDRASNSGHSDHI